MLERSGSCEWAAGESIMSQTDEKRENENWKTRQGKKSDIVIKSALPQQLEIVCNCTHFVLNGGSKRKGKRRGRRTVKLITTEIGGSKRENQVFSFRQPSTSQETKSIFYRKDFTGTYSLCQRKSFDDIRPNLEQCKAIIFFLPSSLALTRRDEAFCLPHFFCLRFGFVNLNLAYLFGLSFVFAFPFILFFFHLFSALDDKPFFARSLFSLPCYI